MFWDIFELWTQNTNIFFKRLNDMLSDSWKNVLKRALEDSQKTIDNKYQKHEIVCTL